MIAGMKLPGPAISGSTGSPAAPSPFATTGNSGSAASGLSGISQSPAESLSLGREAQGLPGSAEGQNAMPSPQDQAWNAMVQSSVQNQNAINNLIGIGLAAGARARFLEILMKLNEGNKEK